ncbi:acyl-CoA thioesterase domain-containing protein [Nocardia sp. NPDC050710]|uniref:thioesterase family protein n=1 Tax=Nocardia sp. NPDC050710 TaxID=3157220 RepID=UPI0033DFA93A
MDLHAFFAVTDQGFEPLPMAASAWSPQMVNGPAICGLIARALENDHCTDDYVPARLTVDLFRPTLTRPMTVATELVRAGRRIRVADAELIQDGKSVARASAIFLRRSAQPSGKVWTRDVHPAPPPAAIAPRPDRPAPPLWGSDGHADGWSAMIGEHQNDSRKRTWQVPLRVIAEEEPSAFAAAAMVGETTSMMTNWGSAGVGFINTDLTLALARPAVGAAIGVEADSHISADGIAVGSATLFDRSGSFGTCVVTALSNVDSQVSFAG